jgi:hypothetical protein
MTTTHVVAVHDAGPRTATAYPMTPPPLDPEVGDVTISWPVILVTLLVMPPLGALQLTHRRDVPAGLRVAIAAVAVLVVALAWACGLGLLPLD